MQASVFPSTEQLLVQGGDARIALDEDSHWNKYGCQPFPDSSLAAFGSSTASIISDEGFAAADRLRSQLLLDLEVNVPSVVYACELHRIRRELMQLCGVTDTSSIDIIFAASGTDIHLIASQLVGGTPSIPTRVVMADSGESGSGVPKALTGCHFSNRAALGTHVMEGVPICGRNNDLDMVTVPIRSADGMPRALASIDAEIEAFVTEAAQKGQRVLLILVDVSKTGFIAPSPSCVLELHRRFPESVDVLVDACQFRLAPSTIRAYLEHGFLVALTGSKFVTGPAFSGALLIPRLAAQRLRAHSIPLTLCAYSSQADWPQSWKAAQILDNVANFGLLLRWEAALAELRAFSLIPEEKVIAFLQQFMQAIEHRLMQDPCFEALSVPELDRRPFVETAQWDHIQTIQPFLLYRQQGLEGKRSPLNYKETNQIYRLLYAELADSPQGLASDIGRLRCQLGQPVMCGNRDGVPVSALRLCASARLVVEASVCDGNAEVVIQRALAALDKTAELVRENFKSSNYA